MPTFVNAFGIFLCKQFIDDMPKELFECAMLDNAAVYDLSKDRASGNPPGARKSDDLYLLGLWNDYQTPLIYLNSSENMTLPLAMSYFSTQHLSDLSATMAAASLL